MKERSMISNGRTKFKTFLFVLYALVNWARVFIGDHTLFMIDFIE